MAEKRIAFTCWSNDPMRINEDGQCGVIYGRVFSTEAKAREYYQPPFNCSKGDVIVRITAETLSDAESSPSATVG
jgi:hypothetical protein